MPLHPIINYAGQHIPVLRLPPDAVILVCFQGLVKVTVSFDNQAVGTGGLSLTSPYQTVDARTAMKLTIGPLMTAVLLLSACAKQPPTGPALPTTDEYMQACRSEVREAIRHQESKVFMKTASYLQRRFLSEAQDLSEEEREQFVDPYCRARLMDFIEEFAKSMGGTINTIQP